jgi:hypothetical protein
MDLSSLQNNLPGSSTRKTSPPPPSALTQDFKAAALAVTKLYQNSARHIEAARQEGYLAAVQEVAALLSQGEFAGNRLREWCAVGLSRITAQQDEENRTRHETQPENQGGGSVSQDEESQHSGGVETMTDNTTPRMQLPLQNPFGDSAFTFQPQGQGFEWDAYRGRMVEPEVMFEVREGGNGRKRGVAATSTPSIWDLSAGGVIGSKRTRHV